MNNLDRSKILSSQDTGKIQTKQNTTQNISNSDPTEKNVSEPICLARHPLCNS